MKFLFLLLFIFINIQYENIENKPKIIKQGKIIYELSSTNSIIDLPELVYIYPTKIIIIFKSEKSRQELTMGNIQMELLKEANIINGDQRFKIVYKDKNTYLLIDNKIKKPIKISNVNEKEYELEYTNETKTLLGYKCKKVLAKYKNKEVAKIYYTDKLIPTVKNTIPYQNKINGLILEYQIPTPHGPDTYTATKVCLKKIKNDLFDKPKVYKKIDFIDYIKLLRLPDIINFPIK